MLKCLYLHWRCKIIPSPR